MESGIATKLDVENATARLEARIDTLRSDFEASLWKHSAGIPLGVLAVGGLLIRFLR